MKTVSCQEKACEDANGDKKVFAENAEACEVLTATEDCQDAIEDAIDDAKDAALLQEFEPVRLP